MRAGEGLSRLRLSHPMTHLFMGLQDLSTGVLFVAEGADVFSPLLTSNLVLPQHLAG